METVGQIDLGAALEPFLIKGVFESVALIDADQKVLMFTALDLGLVNLDRRAASTAKPAESVKGAATAERAPAESKTFTREPVGAPDEFDDEIAGEAYRVFRYPLDVGALWPKYGIRAPITLAGFVSTPRLRSESLALNPLWLAALVLLATLGVLAWPFLKVVLMGPAELLRVGDLVGVVLSLVLGMGLGVLVVLDTVSYRWPDPEGTQGLNRQLESLAHHIAARIEQDMDEGRNLLEDLNTIPPDVLLHTPRLNLDQGKNLGLTGARQVEALCKYRFTQATWISADGVQYIKWAWDGEPPPMLNVEDREYFRAVRDDRAWRDSRGPFFVESVRSRSTGKQLAVFSAPSKLSGKGRREVVAVGMPLEGVIDPLLPPGFDFAVIDADGRSLLHSQIDHAVEENFFEECHHPQRLRDAVLSRGQASMTVRYWGRDRYLLVTPLKNTPWSVLVFFRKDLIRAAHLQTLIVAASLFLVALVLAALHGALARAVTRRGADTWFWPREGSESRLLLTGLVLSGVGALLATLDTRAEPAVALTAAVALPMAGVGAISGLLGTAKRGATWKGPLLFGAPLVLTGLQAFRLDGAWSLGSTMAALLLGLLVLRLIGRARGPVVLPKAGLSVSYIAFALTALLCCSVVPVCMLYRVTWQAEMERFQRSVQLEIARRANPSDPADRVTLANAVWGTTLVPGSAPAATETDCRQGVFDEMLDGLPQFDFVSSEMRGATGRAGCDASWVAGQRKGYRSIAARPPLARSDLVIESAEPVLDVYGQPATWLALGCLLLAALGLVWLLLRRAFLVGFTSAHTVSFRELASMPVHSDLLVLAPPFASLEGLRARRGLEFVPLGEMSAVDLAMRRLEVGPNAVLCFQGFEHVAKDPDLAVALLDWLEGVTGVEPGHVMILSEREPESVLRLPAGHEVQAQARRFVDLPIAKRWERLLGRFVRVVAHDPGDPKRFNAELKKARRSLDAKATRAGVKPEVVEALFMTVRQECQRHAPLQAVGLTVVRVGDFLLHDPHRLVRHIRELADGFYRATWSMLTDQEKLLLSQVAQGHLVNPQNRRALNRLLALRLVVKKSRFRLVNLSFGEFVLGAMTPADLAEWQRSCVTSPWAAVRTPAFVSLAGIGLFLAYTQREFLPAFVGVVGSSVPLLVKLLDLLRGGQGQARPAR